MYSSNLPPPLSVVSRWGTFQVRVMDFPLPPSVWYSPPSGADRVTEAGWEIMLMVAVALSYHCCVAS